MPSYERRDKSLDGPMNVVPEAEKRYLQSTRAEGYLGIGLVLIVPAVLALSSSAPFGLRLLLGLLLPLGTFFLALGVVGLVWPTVMDTELVLRGSVLRVTRPFRRVIEVNISEVSKIIAIQTGGGEAGDDITLELLSRSTRDLDRR